LRAIADKKKLSLLKSPRNTERDSQGNIADNTYLLTQRSLLNKSDAKSKVSNIMSDRSGGSQKKRTLEEEEEL
jgi:hypothetical protein